MGNLLLMTILVSKLTQRPPLPQSCSKNKQNLSKSGENSKEESTTESGQKTVKRNETINLGNNGNHTNIVASHVEYFRFPEQKECKVGKQIVFNSQNIVGNNSHESEINTLHSNIVQNNGNLPYPVLQSEKIEDSQQSTSETNGKSLYHSVKSPTPTLKKPNDVPPSISRPKTPPLKSIGDQTAKAALIRTLITERLNSCSPVSFNN